jgi:hypothetical protein
MKFIARLLILGSLPTGHALWAGPPPNFSDLMRMKRDQPVKAPPPVAAAHTKASTPPSPALRAPRHDAPRYKVVMSGPPKNAQPQLVYLPGASGESVVSSKTAE